jgi:uncharacterized protein
VRREAEEDWADDLLGGNMLMGLPSQRSSRPSGDSD